MSRTRAQKNKVRGSGAARKVTEFLKFPRKDEGKKEKKGSEGKSGDKKGKK